MPRKGGERRFDLLLHPEDKREAAIIAWIDEQRVNYESLRVFMITVLEWAMNGAQPAASATQASSTTVNNVVDTEPLAKMFEPLVGLLVQGVIVQQSDQQSPKGHGPAARLH